MNTLLPTAVARRIPAHHAQADEADPTAYARFHTIDRRFTWYATEYNAESRTFFGLVVGPVIEMTWFSFPELHGAVGRSEQRRVVRDATFRPQALSRCIGERP